MVTCNDLSFGHGKSEMSEAFSICVSVFWFEPLTSEVAKLMFMNSKLGHNSCRINHSLNKKFGFLTQF